MLVEYVELLVVYQVCQVVCDVCDLDVYFYLNEVFYDYIYVGSYNGFLVEQVCVLYCCLWLYCCLQLWVWDCFKMFYDEYQVVVDVIIVGDLECIVEVLCQYIMIQGQWFVDLVVFLYQLKLVV